MFDSLELGGVGASPSSASSPSVCSSVPVSDFLIDSLGDFLMGCDFFGLVFGVVFLMVVFLGFFDFGCSSSDSAWERLNMNKFIIQI